MCQNVWPGRALQDGGPRATNVRAASMYQASDVEQFAPDHHGYPRASRLTTGKTSVGHFGTQSRGCAGQTVRPSLHSISQTSVGKRSILMYSVSVFRSILMLQGSGEAIPSEPPSLTRPMW